MMENNIYYNLARSIMKRGEDAEFIAIELAKACQEFILEGIDLPIEEKIQDRVVEEFRRLINM